MITEVLKNGKFKINVGQISVVCSEDELSEDKTPLKKTRPAIKKSASKKNVSEKIDLHGMTVEEALSLVENTINKLMLDGGDRLEIVHGIGHGKLKGAIHKYLSKLDIVAEYKLSKSNPGVTWVYF